MFARALHSTLLLLALASAAGCSRTPPPPLDPAAKTIVRVQNQAFLDMNVFVVYHGQRIRLGMANGTRTMDFILPIRLSSAESLQFIADPIGGNRRPISEEIMVTPGDVVTVTIPPQ